MFKDLHNLAERFIEIKRQNRTEIGDLKQKMKKEADNILEEKKVKIPDLF